MYKSDNEPEKEHPKIQKKKKHHIKADATTSCVIFYEHIVIQNWKFW